MAAQMDYNGYRENEEAKKLLSTPAFQAALANAGGTGTGGAGAQIYSGNGVPSELLGNPGDTYIDGASGLVYKKQF